MQSLEQGVSLTQPKVEISERLMNVFAIIVCMAFPIFVSQFFLLHMSLRLDESQSLWQTSRSLLDVFSNVASDVHVPLYHTLLWLWRIFIGDTVPAARLLSLLFFVISIPAMYLLGRQAYDSDIAFFSTLLYSISPFMNWYGNEIRMYTLFALLVILNQYFFLRILRSPTANVWAGYAITALFGVYSHYFFFLNLLSQILFFTFHKDLFAKGSFARFVFSASLVAAAFAPWVLYVIHLGQIGFEQPLLVRPSTVDFFSAFGQFLFGFQSDAVNTIILSLWPLVVLFGLFSLRRRDVSRPETNLFILTILCSAGVAFAASYVISPIFVSRYLIFIIPSFYLLLANFLSMYPPRMRALMQFGAICLMLFALGAEIWSPLMPLKENYRAVANYLNQHVTAQDAVIVSAPFTIYPVQYYYSASVPISTLPLWDQYAHGPIPAFNATTLPQQVQSITATSENVYLVLSYDQGYEKTVKDYFDGHYDLLDSENFSRDLSVYVYRIKYDTPLSAIPFKATD